MRVSVVGLVLLSMAVLSSCGGDSETAGAIAPPPPVAVLPVAPPLLANSRVDCEIGRAHV